MIRKPTLVIATALLLAYSSASGSAPAGDKHASMKAELASLIQLQMGADLVSEMQEMGLSEQDAARVVDTLANDAAACTLTAAETAIRRRGDDPAQVLAETALSELGDTFDNMRQFRELMEGCLINALANAGLSPE